MNLTGVACARNEEDIIEAFVRHHLAVLDRLIVLDHGSTDRTPVILKQLQEEGLPLEVLNDGSLGRFQGKKMTALMHRAALEGADWVFLLDADEFIKVRDGKEIHLPEDGPGVLKVAVQTYCAHQQDEIAINNPVERIRHRLAKEPMEDGTLEERRYYLHCIVRREIALDPDCQVLQGSHQIVRYQTEVAHTFYDGVSLAHFSLRSPGQYASKLAIAVLQRMSDHTLSVPLDFFYVPQWEILKNDQHGFERDFYRRIPSYLEARNHPADKILDPVPYLGPPLKHTSIPSSIGRLIPGLFPYLETVARTLSQRPPAPFTGHRTNVEFSLGNFSTGIPCHSSAHLQGGTVFPEVTVLSMKGLDSTGKLRLKVQAPLSYVEIISLSWSRPDGSSLKWNGFQLRENITILHGAKSIGQESYFGFAKGEEAAEMVLHPPEEDKSWVEILLEVRIETDPAIVARYLFQEDPLQELSELMAKERLLQAKVASLSTLRGFLRHQAAWICGFISRNLLSSVKS